MRDPGQAGDQPGGREPLLSAARAHALQAGQDGQIGSHVQQGLGLALQLSGHGPVGLRLGQLALPPCLPAAGQDEAEQDRQGHRQAAQPPIRPLGALQLLPDETAARLQEPALEVTGVCLSLDLPVGEGCDPFATEQVVVRAVVLLPLRRPPFQPGAQA